MSSAREPEYSNDVPCRASDWRALIRTLTAGKPYNMIYRFCLEKEGKEERVIKYVGRTYNPCQVPVYIAHMFALCAQEEHGRENLRADRKQIVIRGLIFSDQKLLDDKVVVQVRKIGGDKHQGYRYRGLVVPDIRHKAEMGRVGFPFILATARNITVSNC